MAGKYRIESQLGEGGMGIVYLAIQTDLQQKVAIKFIQPQFAQSPEARSRFRREARVSASLHHPHAVHVSDYGEHDNHLFLVMDYLQGVSLEAAMRVGDGLSVDEVLDIAHQVTSVLVAAHEIQLVHRDLKPENIFLQDTVDGTLNIQVVDFGLAFIVGRDGEDVGRMTGEGVLGGTPAYMSPEQSQGKPVGPASDVYSLGCVLYELLTGEVPFDGSLAAMLAKHVYEAPKSLQERCPGKSIPTPVENFVLKLMAKSAAHRPPAFLVLDQLQDLVVGDAARQSRVSDPNYVGLRSERALELPTLGTIHQDATRLEPIDSILVGLVGEVDDATVLSLSVNGMRTVRATRIDAQELSTCDVVFMPQVEPTRIANAPWPVVSDIELGDFARMTEMIRSGAADILTRPVSPTALVRKLRRAVEESAAEVAPTPAQRGDSQ